MNKLSMMTAAALFVLPAAAQAKVPLVNLGELCDSLAPVVNHPMVTGFSAWGGCQTGNFHRGDWKGAGERKPGDHWQH